MYRVAAQVMHPACNTQLCHERINPRVPRLALLPRFEVLRVALPRDLAERVINRRELTEELSAALHRQISVIYVMLICTWRQSGLPFMVSKFGVSQATSVLNSRQYSWPTSETGGSECVFCDL